jgi:hypothetical protein
MAEYRSNAKRQAHSSIASVRLFFLQKTGKNGDVTGLKMEIP